MCQNCKSSDLGRERQAALDAALAQCKAANINPSTGGFIARRAWKGYTPQFLPEQRAALDAYNQALAGMKSLHNNYVFERGRAAVEARKQRATIKEQARVDIVNSMEALLSALYGYMETLDMSSAEQSVYAHRMQDWIEAARQIQSDIDEFFYE